MSFSGGNLQLVHYALTLAIVELQSEIGQCPDVIKHADEIDEINRQIKKFDRMRKRVDARLNSFQGVPQ